MRYRYRTDEELKDSGVEWIGKIPKDWEVLKLRNIGNISTSSVDKKINEDEKIVNLVNYVDVYNSKTKELFNNNEYMKVSAKEIQISVNNLLKGDVLFTPSSETVHDIGYSAVVMEDLKNTLYSYHLIRLRFNKEMHLNFKKYIFWSNSFLSYLSSRATGTTRKTLSINNFKNNIVTIPSIKEQEKIANFLDKKTSQFDSIISKKEKLIEKLEEAKKSLISEVVTGKVKVVKSDEGYELVKRKSDEMKDSGVEWLGDIPKDWEVKRIKYVAKLTNNKIKSDYFDKYIGLENIEAKTGRLLSYGNSLDIEIDMSTYFDYKNILFGKLRPYLAKCIVTECRGICSEELLILRADKILPEILKYIMLNNDFINLVNSSAYGAKMPRANWNFISNIKIPIMSDYEQIIVEDFINNNSIKFDTIINKTKTQIEKLKEAKQSLISEAVTGKIEILD